MGIPVAGRRSGAPLQNIPLLHAAAFGCAGFVCGIATL
jgi:hypothetical protein